VQFETSLTTTKARTVGAGTELSNEMENNEMTDSTGGASRKMWLDRTTLGARTGK